jgi:hypothetical protein
MAAVEQVLLGPEKVVSLGTGDLAASTARAEEGELLVRDLGAVLFCEVGGLECMAGGYRGQLLQLKLVNASGGEGEQQERGERGE